MCNTKNMPQPLNDLMPWTEASARHFELREITGAEIRQTFGLRYQIWSEETALRPEIMALRSSPILMMIMLDTGPPSRG